MNLKQYNQHVFRKISSVKKSGEKKTMAIRENFPPSSAQGQIIQGDCFVSLTIRGIAAGLRNLTASPRPSPLPPRGSTGMQPPVLCVGSSPSISCHAAGDRTSCAVARGGRADLSFKLLLRHPGVVGFPFFFPLSFRLPFCRPLFIEILL